MDNVKVVQAVADLHTLVVAKCEQYLGEVVEPERMNPRLKDASDATWLAHLLFMCDEIPKFVAEKDHLGKAMRWLGFVQGVLAGRYGLPIQTMKEVNMPLPDRIAEDRGTG